MSEENNFQCLICVEDFNLSRRKIFDCPFCHFKVCRQCFETYMLQHVVTPKCMECKKEFSRQDLSRQMTKRFMNSTYKIHREQCLLDSEKAMLPATQIIVERIIKNEQTMKKIMKLKDDICELQRQIDFYYAEMNNRNSAGERKIFIRKCPNPDCRGFLSTQWICNLCNHKVCKECNELIFSGSEDADEHKCDPQQVESIKLINRDSKACPKCGELIFKIEGCDQIFCTQCHTAFHWKTGKIETGAIHNPHYFEWIRKTNRIAPEQYMIRCGREIDHHFISANKFYLILNELNEMCRRLIHMRLVTLTRFETDQFLNNQDLRVKFLRNQITEDQFKIFIQKRDKESQKKKEYYRILSMYIQCMTEIIYRHVEAKSVRSVVLTEIKNLIDYVNDCLLEISTTYNSVRYHIREFEFCQYQ